MNDIVICNECKSNGRTNKCYITGYNSKCGHDNGWAYGRNKNGGTIIKCNCCSDKNNQCYITGYDYKCGHDNGWAYVPNSGNATCNSCGKTLNGKWSMENNTNNNSYFHTTTGRYLGISDGYFLYGDNSNWVYSYCKPCWIKEIQKIVPKIGINKIEAYNPNGNATCNSCGKTLNGKWLMENNTNNISYFNTTTGRYLGISDGYFLYGDSPNWVYSYCKPCWIKEIQKIAPRIGIIANENNESVCNLKNKNSELENIINKKNDEIKLLNKKIEEINQKLKMKEDEIIKLKELNKTKEDLQANLISAPISLSSNNYEEIINQVFVDMELEKIQNLLKSSENKEISNLDNLISFNLISTKTLEDFKNICQSKFKEGIKNIIEKIAENINNTKNDYNNLVSIIDEVKKKLKVKELPENIANESITPLQKYLDELTKKTEKMNEIKEEIYKINLKFNTSK